jgi:molybdate transport system substrate-binding protein
VYSRRGKRLLREEYELKDLRENQDTVSMRHQKTADLSTTLRVVERSAVSRTSHANAEAHTLDQGSREDLCLYLYSRRLFLVLLVATVLPSFSRLRAQENDALKVAAAADLQPVLPAILDQFKKQSHQRVTAAYASSATLATQILNGGPFGLFLSADLSFAQKVADAGLADSTAPIPYGRGTLVLWARNDSPVQPLSLGSLRSPSLRTVAVANAEHAPYGRAAKAAIEKLGLTDALKTRLVVAENIAQAAQYAESGNADAGLISLTSALTPPLSADGKYITVPENSYPPLLQGAVILKRGPGNTVAHQFLDFLLSPKIRQQLAERGLKAP